MPTGPGPNDPATAFTAAPSSVGLPCWFGHGVGPNPELVTSVDIEWGTWDEGVAAFTDVKQFIGDATRIEVVNPGTYLLAVDAGCSRPLDADAGAVELMLNRTGDATGPLTRLTGHAPLDGGDQTTVRVSCPLQLAAGDKLYATVESVEPFALEICNFTLLRLNAVGPTLDPQLSSL